MLFLGIQQKLQIEKLKQKTNKQNKTKQKKGENVYSSKLSTYSNIIDNFPRNDINLDALVITHTV